MVWYGYCQRSSLVLEDFSEHFDIHWFGRKHAKMMLCVAKFKGDGMPISQLLLAIMKQPCAKDL